MSSQTTVADARRELAWIVDKDQPYHPDFLRTLNRARQQMIDSGKWRGTKQIVSFEITDNYFTLPYFLDSVLGVTVNGRPSSVFSEHHRYSIQGPGNHDTYRPCGEFLYDGGDHWCVGRDHIPGQELRITLSDPEDLDSVFRVYGKDMSGEKLLDFDGVEGLEIEMNAGTELFQVILSEIYGFQKLPTKGRVTLSSWDGTTETILQVYEPCETRPRYHRYYLSNPSESTKQISCLCKLRYAPVTCDTDFVIPGNLSALMLGMQAVQLQEVRNYQEANVAWGMCYSVLDRDYSAYIGNTLPTMEIYSPFHNSTISVT